MTMVSKFKCHPRARRSQVLSVRTDSKRSILPMANQYVYYCSFNEIDDFPWFLHWVLLVKGWHIVLIITAGRRAWFTQTHNNRHIKTHIHTHTSIQVLKHCLNTKLVVDWQFPQLTMQLFTVDNANRNLIWRHLHVGLARDNGTGTAVYLKHNTFFQWRRVCEKSKQIYIYYWRAQISLRNSFDARFIFIKIKRRVLQWYFCCMPNPFAFNRLWIMP